MANDGKCAACETDDAPEELRLLRKMSDQMDGLGERIEKIEGRAIKVGAVAGAAAGAVSGGIVATGIALIKAKFGL